MTDLERLRKLDAEATPGPWHHDDDELWACATSKPGGCGVAIALCDSNASNNACDDATLIAELRTALSEIIAEIAGLRTERDGLRDRAEEAERERDELVRLVNQVSDLETGTASRRTALDMEWVQQLRAETKRAVSAESALADERATTARLREELEDATTSLSVLSEAGLRPGELGDLRQVRQYAAIRTEVARAALLSKERTT